MFGAAGRLANDDPKVKARLDGIRGYINTGNAPTEALVKLAKLGVVLDDWIAENEVDATAIQCWTSIQKNYGINACTLMSMYSDQLMPSGCEVDVTGVLAMYALQLASGKPSALVDWNNNYASEPDKCVLFHCGNWARSFFKPGEPKMSYGEILATVLGEENTYGTVSARAMPNPLTYARITTDDRHGKIKSLRRRGPHHRRSAGHLRQPRRGGDRRPAEASPLHLQGRLGAPLRHEPIPERRHPPGSVRDVYGVGGVSA